MEAIPIEDRVRDVIERARTGLEDHGLRLDVVGVEESIAHIQYEVDHADHHCGQCEVGLQVGLRSVIDELMDVDGLSDVDWEQVDDWEPDGG